MIEYKNMMRVNGGYAVSICYDKLWGLLINKKMTRTELKESSGISVNVLESMEKRNRFH